MTLGALDEIARIKLEQALERVRVMESIIVSKDNEIEALKAKNNVSSVDNDMLSMMLTSILSELDDQPQEWFELADNMEKLGKLQLLIGKLKSQKQQAESAANVKADFLANMSHEIRTPMNGIMGLTKLLLNTNLTTQQSKYLSAVESSADTLLVIINDILDLSKIEAGKLSIDTKPFSLGNVLSSLVNVFEVKASEKGLSLNTNFNNANCPAILLGDAVKLNQILYNLVGNAIKFTPKGAVTIELEIVHLNEGVYGLKFVVSDTGIGMTDEQASKIFAPFNQASSGTANKFGGTGLGLTIVKRLIELQGGEISVETALGKGSAFSFELTFQQGESMVNNANSLFEADFDFKGVNILLVEDNPVNQMVAEDLLAELGAVVQTTENGKECLNVFDESKHHVILMDMQMPVMNGYEATKILRERGVTTPILALTAHTSAQEQEKCITAGANAYLSKPYKAQDLFTKIRSFLTPNENLVKNSKQTEGDIASELVWDPDHLKNFLGGSERIFDKVFRKIKTEIKPVPEFITNLVENGERNQLADLLHKTKPSVEMLGNLKLYQCLAQLELFCKDETEPAVMKKLSVYICSELRALNSALNSYQK